MSLGKLFRDVRYAVFYRLLLDKSYRTVSLGNAATGCAWYIHPDVLNQRSVVYSGGVGKDITFEHALVGRFGCRVLLCDPSPTGAETMKHAEHQIPQFKFQAVGLSSAPGVLNLASPQNPDEGSWYLQPSSSAQIQVPCTDLTSLMKQNGDTHIDLLKLDIEGSEYGVLDDLLRRRIPVRQICVEYHHGMFPGITRGQSIRSILRLRARGYHVLSQDGNNHTFLWTGAWPPPS